MTATELNVDLALLRVTRLLRKLGAASGPVTLHRGNSTYRIANVLIVDRVNVWTGVTAGYTRADALRALAVMEATLRLVVDSEHTQLPTLENAA